MGLPSFNGSPLEAGVSETRTCPTLLPQRQKKRLAPGGSVKWWRRDEKASGRGRQSTAAAENRGPMETINYHEYIKLAYDSGRSSTTTHTHERLAYIAVEEVKVAHITSIHPAHSGSISNFRGWQPESQVKGTCAHASQHASLGSETERHRTGAWDHSVAKDATNAQNHQRGIGSLLLDSRTNNQNRTTYYNLSR